MRLGAKILPAYGILPTNAQVGIDNGKEFICQQNNPCTFTARSSDEDLQLDAGINVSIFLE